MSNHVSIGLGGRFQCNHCGATHNPFEGGKSVEIWAVSTLSEAFTKKHKRCPKPKRDLCGICFSPEHAWEQHVNATTKSPADWWDCGDTGLSSQAIWKHMMGVPDREGYPYPLDPADFGRCHRLLNAPWAAGWKTRIGEMAKRGPVWARLVARWSELEALFLEEKASGEAPKLYGLMKQLEKGPR